MATKHILDKYAEVDGRLTVGGIDVEEIVSKLGTPCYLYDAAIMGRQYNALKHAVGPSVAIHYSLKANPNLAVAAVFQKLGAGAEVASGEELSIALEAGFSPSRILFAGPGKSEQELRAAIEAKIGSINVESETELDRIIAIAAEKNQARVKNVKKIKIGIRINLDIEVSGPAGKVMIGGPKKFGVDSESAGDIIEKATASPYVELIGFHCFAGTQVTNTATLTAVYRRFAAWVRTTAKTGSLTSLQTINFGGGLGIPFTDDQKELNVTALGKAIRSIHAKLAADPTFEKIKILLEPGRYLVGPAGVYLTRIMDIKSSRGTAYLMTDGGIHHALIPIVMNKNYPTTLVNKLKSRRSVHCVVAGPLCSAADQLSRLVTIPPPEIGDLLGVFNSGAYGYTAGMLYFLSHPTPAEGLVTKGRLYRIRKPQLADRGTLEPL